MKSRLHKTLALAACAALSVPAQASERAELEALRDTTFGLIRALAEQGILPRDRAEALIVDAQKRVDAARAATAGTVPETKPGDPKVVRVPYVPQSVRDQIRDDLREEITALARVERWGTPGSLPEWLDAITIDGDIRVRAQNDSFQDSNAAAFQFPPGYFPDGNAANTQVDRDRLRVRARLGVTARLSADWSAGMRFSTGTLDSPVSTNQTLGRYFNRSSLLVDRVFIRYDNQTWLSVAGGRMANPFFAPTETVWSGDLSFEGIAASFKPRASEAFQPFVTAGAFPLEEREASASDRWLTGLQGGFQWDMTPFIQVRTGLGYFDFRNLEGQREAVGSFIAGSPTYGQSHARFRQRGNTVFNVADPTVSASNPLYGLASDFRLTSASALVTFKQFFPINVEVALDWVRNEAYDEGAIQRRTGLRPTQLGPASGNSGFEGKLTVGMTDMRLPGNWQMFGGYRRLESDAVVDAFNDSASSLGGTNNRGYYLGASYAIERNVWLTARYLTASEIKGPPLAIDVFQVDLNARF